MAVQLPGCTRYAVVAMSSKRLSFLAASMGMAALSRAGDLSIDHNMSVDNNTTFMGCSASADALHPSDNRTAHVTSKVVVSFSSAYSVEVPPQSISVAYDLLLSGAYDYKLLGFTTPLSWYVCGKYGATAASNGSTLQYMGEDSGNTPMRQYLQTAPQNGDGGHVFQPPHTVTPSWGAPSYANGVWTWNYEALSMGVYGSALAEAGGYQAPSYPVPPPNPFYASAAWTLSTVSKSVSVVTTGPGPVGSGGGIASG